MEWKQKHNNTTSGQALQWGWIFLRAQLCTTVVSILKCKLSKLKKKLHIFFAQSSVTTQTELASCSLQTADYNTNVV